MMGLFQFTWENKLKTIYFYFVEREKIVEDQEEEEQEKCGIIKNKVLFFVPGWF